MNMSEATDLEKLLAEVTPGIRHISTKYQHKTYHDVDIPGYRLLQDIREPDARLIAMAPALARKVIAAEKLVEAVFAAYTELLATVEGECPSLVNEDSGGSAVLINLILEANAALAAWEAVNDHPRSHP